MTSLFVVAMMAMLAQQSPPVADVPSLEAIRALFQRGIELRRSGQFDDAGRPILEAKAMAEALGNCERIATALINYSAIPGMQADYPAALAALDEAWTIAEELDDDELRASVLANQGILARLLGDYDAAVKAYTDALRGSVLGRPKRLHYAVGSLCGAPPLSVAQPFRAAF